MILLHPMMPFVTEELWQTTRADPGTLALARWPDAGPELADPAADRELTWVIGLIEDIRSARAQMGVAVGLKLDLVCVDLDEAGRQAWARNEALIRRLARIDRMTSGAAPRGSITLPCDGGLFALPLAGVIDIAAEQARLQKALDALEKELAGLQARLSNPAFLAKAKEEVVDEARARIETAGEEAAKLRAALARLAGLGGDDPGPAAQAAL
jgi:valyl-tRNA synthetase